MNVCVSCDQDFAGLEDFDAHRVGKHEYTAREADDGRRCLDLDEMVEGGWLKNPRGRWLSPRNVRKRVHRGRVFAASRVSGGRVSRRENAAGATT